MQRILTLSLLLAAMACSSPVAQSGEATAALSASGPRPYTTGVLPLDLSTMVYQQNNVNGPPTELFLPTAPDLPTPLTPATGCCSTNTPSSSIFRRSGKPRT